MAAEHSPTRETELHAHYAANAIAAGHAADCEMVMTPVNWPTMSGRPSCTCPVGGNTAEAQIAHRTGRVPQPALRGGAQLKAEIHRLDVTDRIRLLDWLAEHRTGQLRPALRDWIATGQKRPELHGPPAE